MITGARQAEFDYPTGEGEGGAIGTDALDGTTGIKLDTTLMRLLFALRFRDLDLLISDQVTAESQLLFHRSIADRLPTIAPFLRYDKDPYLVIDEARRPGLRPGRLHDERPLPERPGVRPGRASEHGPRRRPFNYIRNSVKIAMDAYDGTMNFYVADPNDPIIRA